MGPALARLVAGFDQGLLGMVSLSAMVLVFVLASWGVAAEQDYGLPQVEFINQRIASGWQDAGLKPAAQATDEEWCRRLFLDLIGRVPRIDELEQFLAEPSSKARPALVDRLLGEEYVDEYARHQTDVWSTILIGRNVANDRVSRPGMRQYLRRAFSRNIPYDKFMEELVTATGLNANRLGVEGFNGATNFLSGKLEDRAVQATAKTAQIFLGIQVQCTQCHNHKFNKWKQNQFWEFNAFFRQARGLRRFDGGRDIAAIELVDEDFAGESGTNPLSAEIFYEPPNGLVKAAFPVFVDGTEISKNGYLPENEPGGVNRRQELARLIRESPLFAKAIVNRVWAQFLGFGFTKPIDDFGDHNPPSDPELLDGLAERFSEQSYDLKALNRWVVLSSPYSLSSRMTDANQKDDPSLGERPRFSRFYVRQMQAEQLYESLLTATQAGRAGSPEEAAGRKDRWLSQFVVAFGTDEGDDATTFNGSIPQVLMMFNGDLVKDAVNGQAGFLAQVVRGGESNRQKIDRLYLAALSRRPSRPEYAKATQLLSARGGDAAGALQDVWWAVLNSNEFILNH